MSRVGIVPGAAVRSYVRPAVDALRERGIDAELLPAPGQPGTPADLAEYGRELAGRLDLAPVDLLVGLSVGAQAAAVAARAEPGAIGRLMLVGPTVDPATRTAFRLVGRWIAGGRAEPGRLLADQLPDWWRAGPRRIAGVVRSSLDVEIERVLDPLPVPTDVVHAEHDQITSHAYASRLATGLGARLLLLPGASHSWPYRHERAFADLIEDVLKEHRS